MFTCWPIFFTNLNKNCCHQMSYFKAKMHQNRFLLGFAPNPAGGGELSALLQTLKLDSWVKCLLWVNQPGQLLSLPSLHVITWGWRPLTTDQACVCMAVWLQVKVCGRGLSLRPVGCTPVLSVTQKRRCVCSSGLWRYIQGGPKSKPFSSIIIKSH